MEGLKLQVEATVVYTVTLTEEDMDLVKQYISDNCDKDMMDIFAKENILDAVNELLCDDRISLYDDGKAVESDFYTNDISWSNYEERSPEEILEEMNIE